MNVDDAARAVRRVLAKQDGEIFGWPDEVIREAAESEHPFDKELEIVEAVLSAVYPRSTAAPLVRLGIACRPANRDPEYWATTECRRIDYRFTAPDRETAKRMVAEKYGSVRFTR